jgi:hypothetical protein
VQEGAVKDIDSCCQGSEGRVERDDLLEHLRRERGTIARCVGKGKRGWEEAEERSEAHRTLAKWVSEDAVE